LAVLEGFRLPEVHSVVVRAIDLAQSQNRLAEAMQDLGRTRAAVLWDDNLEAHVGPIAFWGMCDRASLTVEEASGPGQSQWINARKPTR
jgi:hypothetical protein